MRPSARLIVFRANWWLKTIKQVEVLASRLQEKLGSTSIVLYGSYARGDFNKWSDIDLLVISDRFRGVRVLDRYRLVESIVREGGVEPVLLAPEEARSVLSRPGWRHALKHAVIVVDHYNVASLVESITGKKPLSIGELKKTITAMREKAEKEIIEH